MRFGPCLCIALKGSIVETTPGSAISNSEFFSARIPLDERLRSLREAMRWASGPQVAWRGRCRGQKRAQATWSLSRITLQSPRHNRRVVTNYVTKLPGKQAHLSRIALHRLMPVSTNAVPAADGSEGRSPPVRPFVKIGEFQLPPVHSLNHLLASPSSSSSR